MDIRLGTDANDIVARPSDSESERASRSNWLEGLRALALSAAQCANAP